MTAQPSASAVADSLGARVVCGVDGSPEGLEAAHQGARLVDPTGSLTLVGSFNTAAAAQTGYLASRTATELEHQAQGALHDAAAAIGMRAETRLIDAEPLTALRTIGERLNATLLVVGTHDLSRGLGILLGSVATGATHMPARATLIARDPGTLPERFPRSVAVGEDGSPGSRNARSVACAVAERFDIPLRRILCTEGDVDSDAVHALPGPVEIVHGKAQRGLARIGDEVDLLVVGATGRRGLKALGSVSERVAHSAKCSVLVIPTAG